MKDHRIGVSTDPEIMKDLNPELQQLVKDKAFYNNLKKIYGTHIYPEVINNISFFVLCYPYICITLYLDNIFKSDSEGRKYFEKESMRIQKRIDRYVKSRVKGIVMATLECDSVVAKQLKQSISNLVANIMSYYYQLLAYAKEIIGCNSSVFYFKIIRKFKSIKNDILNDSLCKDIEYDHECLSILRVMIDAGASDNADKTAKEKMLLDALEVIARESICTHNVDMQNSFETYWLQRKLKSLLMKCGKIDKNDFMDYGIMQEAYYCKSVRCLLTFDDKIIRVMRAIKDSEMFQNSVKTIEAFEKAAG